MYLYKRYGTVDSKRKYQIAPRNEQRQGTRAQKRKIIAVSVIYYYFYFNHHKPSRILIFVLLITFINNIIIFYLSGEECAAFPFFPFIPVQYTPGHPYTHCVYVEVYRLIQLTHHRYSVLYTTGDYTERGLYICTPYTYVDLKFKCHLFNCSLTRIKSGCWLCREEHKKSNTQ